MSLSQSQAITTIVVNFLNFEQRQQMKSQQQWKLLITHPTRYLFYRQKKRTEIFKHTKNQFQIVLFCFFFFILLKFDFFLFFEIKINCWFGDKKKMREKPTVTHICFCFCFIENLLLNAILLYALLNTYTKSTQTHTIKYTHKQLSKRATICFYFSSLFFFF